MCGLPPFDSPLPALRDGIFLPNDEGDISSSPEGVNDACDIFFCDVSVRPVVPLPGYGRYAGRVMSPLPSDELTDTGSGSGSGLGESSATASD